MRPYSFFVLPLALSGLFLAGCRPENTFAPPPPPLVTTSQPDQETVTVFHSIPGRMEAVESVEIRARVAGYLNTVSFEDGALVTKGQALYEIEPDPYIATLNSAKAQRAQAEANRNLADAALKRKKKAFENQAVSELDVLTAEADVQVADAAVQSADAAKETAELNLSYTKLSAPIDGRISRNYVTEGNLVGGTEATLLALLTSINPIHVYFSVDERRLLDLKDAYSETDIETQTSHTKVPPVQLVLANGELYGSTGSVDYGDSTLDADTGTMMARAVFENPSETLHPGMFARVQFSRELENAMLVPELSIQRDLVGPYVLVVNPESMVEAVYVELGPRVEQRRVIRSGLDRESQVIIKGLQSARPGIKVQTGGAPAAQPKGA